MVTVSLRSCETLRVDAHGTACRADDAACIAASPRCALELGVDGHVLQFFEAAGSPQVMSPAGPGTAPDRGDRYRVTGPRGPTFVPADDPAIKTVRQLLWNLELQGPYTVLRDKLLLARQVGLLADDVLGNPSLKPDPQARPQIMHDAARLERRRRSAFTHLAEYFSTDVIARIAKTQPQARRAAVTADDIAAAVAKLRYCDEQVHHIAPTTIPEAEMLGRARLALGHAEADPTTADPLTPMQAFDLACTLYATSSKDDLILPDMIQLHADRIYAFDQERLRGPRPAGGGKSAQELLWEQHREEITTYARSAALRVFHAALRSPRWEIRKEAAGSLVQILQTFHDSPVTLAIDAHDRGIYLHIVNLLQQAPLEELSFEEAGIVLEELFGFASRLRAMPTATDLARPQRAAMQTCLVLADAFERSQCLAAATTTRDALDQWRKELVDTKEMTLRDPSVAARLGMMRIAMHAAPQLALEEYASLFEMARIGTAEALQYVTIYYDELRRVDKRLSGSPVAPGWRTIDPQIVGAFFALAAVQDPRRGIEAFLAAPPAIRQTMIAELFAHRTEVAVRIAADTLALAPPHPARIPLIPAIAAWDGTTADQPEWIRAAVTRTLPELALAVIHTLLIEPAPHAATFLPASAREQRRDHVLTDLLIRTIPRLDDGDRKRVLTAVLPLATTPPPLFDQRYLVEQLATVARPSDRHVLTALLAALQATDRRRADDLLRAAHIKLALAALHTPIFDPAGWQRIPPDHVFGYFADLIRVDAAAAQDQFVHLPAAARKRFVTGVYNIPTDQGVATCMGLLQGSALTPQHRQLLDYVVAFLQLAESPRALDAMEPAMVRALANVVQHADALVAPSHGTARRGATPPASAGDLRRDILASLDRLAAHARGTPRLAVYQQAWIETYFAEELAMDATTRTRLFASFIASEPRIDRAVIARFRAGIARMARWPQVDRRELYLEHLQQIEQMAMEDSR